MNTSESLSSILASTLDIIGNEGKSSVNEISAASMLLNERKRQKRSIDSGDFVPFEAKKKPFQSNPLMEQVSTTTVDPPTYWNSGAAPLNNKQLNKKNYNKNLKKAKKKGENYKEKHSEKINMKLTKKAYFHKLKFEA